MNISNTISDVIAAHPRANLIQVPPVIHRLPRLSSRYGREIHILREDMTGFGLGGNKTRKVEFLLGDALARGATTLLTMKATSFSRNAAAGACACGLELHVVLAGIESAQNPFSQSVFAKWGAKLHYEEDDPDALSNRVKTLEASLRNRGKKVYVLHPGGSDAIGALGYVDVFEKICNFSARTGIHFSHILHSTSSAGTQAGLVVGQGIADYDVRIIGVSASRSSSDQARLVRELALATVKMLDRASSPGEVIVDDGFVGPGYAQASREGEIAAQTFAELEGILLDTVYTGKAAAALIDYLENDRFEEGPILFIHTGGNADIYY